jgi:hypothetical protein
MIAALDTAVKAVCPIHGVSFGRVGDKATWRIDFKDEATAEQRAAAQDVLASFDPAAKTPEDLRLEADSAERLQAKLDSAVMQLANATPAQLVAYARNNFPSLSLAEQNRLGAILFALAVAVRPLVR